MRTIHSLQDCIEKEFDYLSNVAKENFEFDYEVEGKFYTYESNIPKRVRVSDKLFRQYNCLNYNCCKCCDYFGFWNIYTEKQFEKMREVYGTTCGKVYTPIPLRLNPVQNTYLWVHNHTEAPCPHLDKERNMCLVHKENPMHCALPLLKVHRVGDTTNITRMYFGRNSRTINCPVRFEPMDESGFQRTIEQLKMLKAFGEEFKVKTYMDEIIEEVEYKWKKMKEAKEGQQGLGDWFE